MIYRKEAFIVFLAYALFAIILFPHYKYFVDSPDALQYIVIAQKYSVGNFAGAINSFWSPLFSWLLSVFLLSGIEPFYLAKILQLIIGAFALLGICRILSGVNNKLIFYAIMFAVILFILSCSLLVLTADLLFLTLSVWLAVIFNNYRDYADNKTSFLIIGIVGALLYFSKSIGFGFFLLSFTAFNVYLYFKKQIPAKTLFIKYILTVIVFSGVSSTWIYLISKKENKFVISSAVAYNIANIGPQSNPDIFSEVKHPYSWQGLISPPDESSLCAWEVPHKMNLEKWSLFDSGDSFTHYLTVIGKNLLSIRSFYFGLDAGTILCLMFLLLWFYRKDAVKNIFSQNPPILILSICCTLPYIFLLVMERYIWINMIVIAVLACCVFQNLMEKNKIIGTIFLSIFILFFIRQPLIEFRKYYDTQETIFNAQPELAEFINGETASVISLGENPDDHYAQSSLVSYLAGQKYFGMLSVPQQGNNMESELKKFNIRYLLSWNNSAAIPDSMYSEIKTFPQSGIHVYRLK